MKDFSGNQFLVLVIEEKQEVLQQVSLAMASANYATCCCTTAETALAAVDDARPDLIICSASLNGESGLDLCQRIKQYSGMETTPVMILSSGQIPDIIRRHNQMGGTYHMRKPFDPSVLLELADKALQTPALVNG
jgi:two-component system, NtrC family, response regulator GlrR